MYIRRTTVECNCNERAVFRSHDKTATSGNNGHSGNHVNDSTRRFASARSSSSSGRLVLITVTVVDKLTTIPPPLWNSNEHDPSSTKQATVTRRHTKRAPSIRAGMIETLSDNLSNYLVSSQQYHQPHGNFHQVINGSAGGGGHNIHSYYDDQHSFNVSGSPSATAISSASASSLINITRLDDGGNLTPGRTFRHPFPTTVIFCIAYAIVFIVGFIGNFLVIGVVFRLPRMRNVTNYFIMNLAIADMLVILFCLPGTLMSNIFVPWVLGWGMCKVVPYIQGVSVAASVYSLIAVSVDRFLAIWWPLKCQITTRRARIILVMIWIYAIFVPLPWLFFFDLVPVFKEDDTLFCLEVWPDYLNGNIYFMVFNVLLGYIVPMLMISMCYVLIWFKVWKRTIPTDSRDAHMERMQQNSKVKVIKMLVVVIIIFVVSWLPLYAIFARIKFGGELAPWEENLLPILAPIAQFLGTANSSINPILYAYFNNKYRHGFKMLLKSRECCSLVRYYDSVNMANSSSTSLRKSSYYTAKNKSLHKQASQDRYISCSLNKPYVKSYALNKQISLDRNSGTGSCYSSRQSSRQSRNSASVAMMSGIHRQASQETYATLLLNKQLSQERYATYLLSRQASLREKSLSSVTNPPMGV